MKLQLVEAEVGVEDVVVGEEEAVEEVVGSKARLIWLDHFKFSKKMGLKTGITKTWMAINPLGNKILKAHSKRNKKCQKPSYQLN